MTDMTTSHQPPPPPSSSTLEDKNSAPLIPLTSPRHLCHCLNFSPHPPPSRLLVSSIIAPNPDEDDDDDNAVSVASTATTIPVCGTSPPGLGVALSLNHFALLLLVAVVDIPIVVSALPVNAAASVSS